MKIIGLTGGIGSGKTTIAKMFEKLGVPVYYADDEAKKLMNSNRKIHKELVQVFGEEAFKDGELNRAFIANVIFNDENKLNRINAIVHPEVERHFKKWVSNKSSKYVIQENALIFESGAQDRFDKIITITAPIHVRINRVKNRDSVSKEKVLERMHNQLDDSYKIKNSFFSINNIDLEASRREVNRINEFLIKS